MTCRDVVAARLGHNPSPLSYIVLVAYIRAKRQSPSVFLSQLSH